MNNIDIANGIIFQRLHLSIESFADRLICQKKIYLLQVLGSDLGYKYNWYIHGPYSPTLTNYMYNNINVLLTLDLEKYELSTQTLENINAVNRLQDNIREDFNVCSWYELLASIVYINENRYSWGIDAQVDLDGGITNKVIEQKPQYTSAQCAFAIERLKRENFLRGNGM